MTDITEFPLKNSARRATILDKNPTSHRGEFVVDFSLSLINKTGAYYICRDIIKNCPDMFCGQRYWRAQLQSEPQGLARRVLGQAMLMELALPRLSTHLRLRPAARDSGQRMLFLDPLYVLFSGVCESDIVLCHDVGPLTMPEAFGSRTTARYRDAYAQIKLARPAMVFVSDASRMEFISLFGDDFRFLEVIPLYTRSGSEHGDMRAPPDVRGRFLLTVGALEARKNHRRSIEAYRQSGLFAQGVEYILCGPRGNNSADVLRLVDETPGVRWLGYVGDDELRWLYRNASGFVLPSLLEGFGLPALEAAKNGLIPMISLHGGLLEAVSAGAVLVDPTSVRAISDAMVRLVHMSDQEREHRVALVQGHARSMSPERFVSSWRNLLAGDRSAVAAPSIGSACISA